MQQAGAIVHQSISQIRTVAAYNGEDKALKEYDDKLDYPEKVLSWHLAVDACKNGVLVDKQKSDCCHEVEMWFALYNALVLAACG